MYLKTNQVGWILYNQTRFLIFFQRPFCIYLHINLQLWTSPPHIYSEQASYIHTILQFTWLRPLVDFWSKKKRPLVDFLLESNKHTLPIKSIHTKLVIFYMHVLVACFNNLKWSSQHNIRTCAWGTSGVMKFT